MASGRHGKRGDDRRQETRPEEPRARAYLRAGKVGHSGGGVLLGCAGQPRGDAGRGRRRAGRGGAGLGRGRPRARGRGALRPRDHRRRLRFVHREPRHFRELPVLSERRCGLRRGDQRGGIRLARERRFLEVGRHHWHQRQDHYDRAHLPFAAGGGHERGRRGQHRRDLHRCGGRREHRRVRGGDLQLPAGLDAPVRAGCGRGAQHHAGSSFLAWQP